MSNTPTHAFVIPGISNDVTYTMCYVTNSLRDSCVVNWLNNRPVLNIFDEGNVEYNPVGEEEMTKREKEKDEAKLRWLIF